MIRATRTGYQGGITIENNNDDADKIAILKRNAYCIDKLYADGEDLKKCCSILGRFLPPMEEYYFYGDNAKEIAANFPQA